MWTVLFLGDESVDKEIKVSHGVFVGVRRFKTTCWPTELLFLPIVLPTYHLRRLNSLSQHTAGAAMLAEGLADLKEAESSGNLEAVVEDLLQGAGVDTGDRAGAIATGLRVFNPLGLANPRAVFSTTAGDFTAEIFLDQMPLTSSNFVDLASSGFYDGTHIHRVIDTALFACCSE